MKTFEITEDQIKDIALGGETTIKEMFPSVFESKETPEEFFNSIFSKDLIRKIDLKKYPNSRFYFDGETMMLEIEKVGEIFYAWLNYDKIWNPISTKNNWSYYQTGEFFKVMIEYHFNLRDVIPNRKFFGTDSTIEDHFNLRDKKLITKELY